MPDSLCDMPLVDVAALLRREEVSPVELAREALERIERFNPRLNALWTVTADLALEQARAAEAEIAKGQYLGPLHGVPVALKDLIYTKGIRTTAGSKIFTDFIPDYDATVVQKLRQAGAVLVGKTSLHELAYGITNNNPHFGATRNPWDLSCTPGGSSGGSAVAVATGMCFAALGTDTGGSIRIPSSFCGVAGLKPTFGRVSLHGVYPLGYTLDHVGPLARTVADAGAVYQAIAGFDSRDAYSARRDLGEIRLSQALEGIRVGVPHHLFLEALQPEVLQLAQAALPVLEQCGARLRTIALKRLPELTEVSRLTLAAEAYALHRAELESRPNDFGPDVKKLLDGGRDITASDYIATQQERAHLRREIEQLFDQVDVIALPATPLTAFAFNETRAPLGERVEDVRPATTRLLRGFNASGHPALSVCCGFTRSGLPAGLQLIGRLWNEAAVLHAGYAYEQATDWHARRPPLPA